MRQSRLALGSFALYWSITNDVQGIPRFLTYLPAPLAVILVVWPTNVEKRLE